ncbi:primosomal protein N' [Candidatus Phytoplasma oryzae]|uniref:Primosomal protein N n=1 Tax=Candidatus Phytoplasma oryzae TaxID=203274 RepID=A0A139JRC2_9MOLU|nr:primosomal protein N' [Candidatus Phytoplasma oryzae]RAM58007.1 hypothetical protein DH96_00410 [Candidatus Phytoplasma oryzae]
MNLIDMKKELQNGNLEPFSSYLMNALKEKIEKNEKILLFINSRGFSPFILCFFCGRVLKCLICNSNLIFFSTKKILKCCFCNYKKEFLFKCFFCKKKLLKQISFGIEYIEDFLKKKFDNKIKIARIDSDSISGSQQYKQIIKEYKENKIDILLGTEMISKKVSFPGISLVGIIMADVLLNIPTFKSSEKTFQLIIQVAHHCENKNNIVVQSYNTEHYSIQNAINYNIKGFLKKALEDRELSNNPPFVFLSKIIIYNKSIMKLLKVSKKIKIILEESINHKIKVFGPSFPRIFKKNNIYRVFLTIKYKDWPLNLDLINQYISQDSSIFIYFDLFANIV